MNSKPTFADQVALQLIAQLKAGTAPWQRPWDGNIQGFMPYNPTTGKRYKGINAVWLLSQEREDSRWLTYNQAKSQGAQVKKGEKGSVIQYWKFTDDIPRHDDKGNIIRDGEGQPIKDSVKLERPKVFHSVVFNADQIEGLPEVKRLDREWDPIDRAEAILLASGAQIKHVASDRAFYAPSSDVIQLPLREQFTCADNYYATALHELGHWSGNESRLNRDLMHPFGSVAYAKEELRAEIASMLLGDELGIGHDVGQHAAYVDSWIKVLEDDHLEIFRAAADAEKIQAYLFSLEQQQAQALEEGAKNVNRQHSSLTDQKTAPEAKHYIDVPYQEKEEAKHLGAKWDRKGASWYFTDQADKSLFGRWLEVIPSTQTLTQTPDSAQSFKTSAETGDSDQKTYLAVPYTERLQAKKLGAKWDKVAKSWYTTELELSQFERWLPENTKLEQSPAMSPREEFADVLRSVNGDITGGHPIMDGQKHRFKVDGDRANEKSGFYVGFLVGHPAGYVKNNRTGVEIKWKSKGYLFKDAEKAKIQAETAAKQQARNQEIIAKQQKTAAILSQLWAIAPNPPDDHPYLANKQVNTDGLRMVPATIVGLPDNSPIRIGSDKTESLQLIKTYENHPEILIFTAGDLLVPVTDTQDQLWSLQTIDPNGIKRFVKGSKMEGGFYLTGGMAALQKAPVLVVAEGMATAKNLEDCLGFAVVAAFASGNLASVVNQLHQYFPEKKVIVAGDDDRLLETKQGINVGREKAEQAAKAVGGKALFPVFADSENQLTDFNDLATKSVFGKAGLERQVKTVVAMEIEKQTNQLGQSLGHQQGREQVQTKSRSLRV
jgi:putative DNA primase/helicase